MNTNALPSGVNRRIRSIGICPSRKCGQTLDGDVSMAIVALMGHAGLVSDFFFGLFSNKARPPPSKGPNGWWVPQVGEKGFN